MAEGCSKVVNHPISRRKMLKHKRESSIVVQSLITPLNRNSREMVISTIMGVVSMCSGKIYYDITKANYRFL